jgi:hypothetical protein
MYTYKDSIRKPMKLFERDGKREGGWEYNKRVKLLKLHGVNVWNYH